MAYELRERVNGLVRVWAALLLPLGAWSLQMAARYALQPWLCRHGGHIASDVFAIVAILLALAGAVLGWSALAKLRSQPELHGSTQSHQRAHFMAALGLGLCLLFVLVIIAQWIPERILSPCPM